MLSRTRLRAAATAALATTVTVGAAVPVSAFVVFEPSPRPVLQSWAAEVSVSVDWAGVSVLIPSEWQASVKRAPAVASAGASLLVLHGPEESLCLLDYYLADTVETWQDVGVRAAAELTIDGHPAERFDDMIGTGAATASAYSIDAGEFVYSLLCSADQAPADRWLSIAQTISVP